MAAQRRIRLLLVAGARPNFVKIAPLVSCLSLPHHAAGAQTLLVHTGQHYDETLSRLFFDQLAIPRPDVHLGVPAAAGSSHAQQTAEILVRFEPVMEWKPQVVVVVGDVNSTLACALVAAKRCVPVAHVEAGLRSFDRTMPEEINRLLTDAISDFLFASEPSGVTNLRSEGVPEEKIHLVGNVMIDSLRKFLPLARQSSALRDFRLADSQPPAGKPRPFALLTMHRPSNVDEKEKLATLLDALAQLGEQIPVLFPAHPRTRDRIERFGLGHKVRTEWSEADRGVLLCPPIGYLEFLHLMHEATFVLTDSGGIQEETTVLGVPCLTLRENTERPITVEEGTNTLVGTNPDRILSAAHEILAGNGKSGRTPALWDGQAADRIVTILLDRLAAGG